MKHKITIKNIDMPRSNMIKDEVKWICDSLGLMNGRDLENISFKVMFELLDLCSGDDLISTAEISKELNIEPYRINHHIRGLIESGIVFREKRKIALRGGSLTSAIEEMKRDSDAMFSRLLEVSKKIDKKFKL